MKVSCYSCGEVISKVRRRKPYKQTHLPISHQQNILSFTQVKSQPLVPIGVAATTYFLATGLRSFQKRDPVGSQRAMRNRVMAQFATLVFFIGYMGVEQQDWRFAPMYQDATKKKKESGEESNS